MNKRASATLMMLFELLIVIAVATIIFQVASGYAKSDTTLKINTADDMAMMVHTLVSVAGDAQVGYPHNLSKFTLIMDSSRVLVKKSEEKDVNKVETNFNLPQGYSAEGLVKGESQVCLEKKQKRIILKAC